MLEAGALFSDAVAAVLMRLATVGVRVAIRYVGWVIGRDMGGSEALRSIAEGGL